MKKSILSVLLVFCVLFSVLAVGAAAADSWQVNWELSRKGELTVKGTGALPDNWVKNHVQNSWYQ